MPINTDMDFISELIDEVIEKVTEERWLPIVGYEGLYEVSDLGRVRSLARNGTSKNGRILKQQNYCGYLSVILNNKGHKLIKVHRLVLLSFLPIEEKKQVDHINQIKTDNRLENLRWATGSENMRYRKKWANCSSQYKGVSWNKRDNLWEVSIFYNNKKVNLKRFDTEIEAAKAYNTYIIENNLQEFAILNSI